MKKALAFLLALPLAVALAGCSGSNGGSDADVSYESAESILTAIWDTYADDEKFPIMGGDPANAVMDAPAAHSLSDTDSLTMNFGIPADLTGSVEDAASFMHAMNANTLSTIVVRLADGTDIDAAVSAIGTELENKQWLCGCPDKYIIAKIPGNYLLVAYGVQDAIGPFDQKLTSNIAGQEVVVDKPLA
ncbi:MAG: hypothetical protein IJC51_01985 [Eggerthellaceae bacterium]|nr:hypothetical protein [Eggerthellaceae bacterium]